MQNLLTDLALEYERLDAMLQSLTPEQWDAPSDAAGWSVCDVVTHLAVSEEMVSHTINHGSSAWTEWDGKLDDAMASMVDENKAEPNTILTRWQAATSSSLAALTGADPDVAVAWAAAPLRPATLATTRLAEHWAHALDIATPLGLQLPDTERLSHIAWLGHRTIPYGCSLQNIEPQPIRAELTSPAGEIWSFGPQDAASVVTGPAGDFCRIGAQRMTPQQSQLVTTGPFAAQALAVLRNYAA